MSTEGLTACTTGRRLFPVAQHEALLTHEDMHFNVRATQRVVEHGSLAGWFDTQSWYPYGRVLDNTVRA